MFVNHGSRSIQSRISCDQCSSSIMWLLPIRNQNFIYVQVVRYLIECGHCRTPIYGDNPRSLKDALALIREPQCRTRSRSPITYCHREKLR